MAQINDNKNKTADERAEQNFFFSGCSSPQGFLVIKNMEFFCPYIFFVISEVTKNFHINASTDKSDIEADFFCIQWTTRITETGITNLTRITNEMATSSNYLMKYFNGILAVLLE